MSWRKHKNAPQPSAAPSPQQFLQREVRRLALGPCYISRQPRETGVCHIIVTRRHDDGTLCFAWYHVDVFCRGVMASFYLLNVEPDQLQSDFLIPGRYTRCSYAEAHGWVWGAVAFAEKAGISPHPSFDETQYMLQEADSVSLLPCHVFGKDGQHFLVAKTQTEADLYLPLLAKALGDNFKYIIPLPLIFGNKHRHTDEHDKDGMYDDELLGGEEDFLDDDEDLLDDDEEEDDDLYDDDVDLLNDDDGDIYNQGLSESETNAFDVLDEDDWK